MRATVVIAKRPVPGRVKTRLSPPLSADQAAALAEAALSDTLDEVMSVPGRHVVAIDGPPTDEDEAAPWLPPGCELTDQGGGTLNDRLDHVCRTVGGPLVVVAMDTPQLTRVQIESAHAGLDAHDVVLGPTDDGGYWLVGCTAHIPNLFTGVPMSTSETLSEQLRQAERLGLRVATIETLRDVDAFADAVAVGQLIPERRFGRLVAELPA